MNFHNINQQNFNIRYDLFNSFNVDNKYKLSATAIDAYNITRLQDQQHIFKVENSSCLSVYIVAQILFKEHCCPIFFGRKNDDIIFTLVPYSPITNLSPKVEYKEEIADEDFQKFLKQEQSVSLQEDKIHLACNIPPVLLTDFDDPLYEHKRSAIDLGCGSGFTSRMLIERGYEVVAVDIMKKAVDQLKQQQKFFKNLKVVQADIIDYPLKEKTFSMVVCSLVLPHIHKKHWVGIIKKIYDALIPGGNFICDFSIKGSCVYRMPKPSFAFKLLESCGFIITKYGVDERLVEILATKKYEN